MKSVLILLSLFIVSGLVYMPFTYALTVSDEKQVVTYSTDSKVKKYDSQLAKLRAEILKLQERISKITKLRQDRVAELDAKASPTKVKNEVTTNSASVKKLEDFPASGPTWRSRFLSTETPPTNAFKAFYFNTNQPSKVVATAQVDAVDINYAWDKGPGFTIVSEDFGGYWIGDFVLTKDEEMELNVSQSWSETRVILDGYLIYKGGSNTSSKLLVPKGLHTLEIEYVNNWHTVGFSASLRTASAVPKAITASDVKTLNHKEVWYAGVYESGAANNVIRLVPKTTNVEPKLLFLSSYSSVKWDASLLKNTGITGIIYNSYEPGSQVINVPQDISVYVGKIPYGYNLKALCSTNDRNGLMGCDGIDDFTKVYSAITGLTTKPLTGFAGTYSATELALPGTVLTEVLVKDALAHPAKLRADSKKYLETQKIDNIL